MAGGDTIAGVIARFLEARGVTTVFALQGGHIQPIWDRAAALGVRFVDVRDERAAVHMAHAHGELAAAPGVAPGIAMAAAGPGVTNTVTAIANADVARAPVVLIGGAPPRPQIGLGALQEVPQVAIMRPITRAAWTVRDARQVPAALDRAWRLALGGGGGDGGDPGPVYIEFPTDVLRERLPESLFEAALAPPPPPRRRPPDRGEITRAVAEIWSAEKPLVISGRGARGAGDGLVRLLDATGAVYLDTQESRGLVPDDHPATVAAMRGAAMRDADLVVLVGRRLDYQLGYGSPAVFPNARFVRLADVPGELSDNRRGVVEVAAAPALALDAIVDEAAGRAPKADRSWAEGLRARHVERAAKLKARMAEEPAGSDGHMHPYRLLGAIDAALDPDSSVIADGGDILSFARIALSPGTYLDAGALGCLGVGVPFGVAAALACPGRKVISINGDGAFGFNAMEIDTALRHDARAVFVVANNGGWNIERHDQLTNYDGRVRGAELRFSDYAAMARALGLHAERIEDPAALPGALERAFAKAPALLDVLVTRDAVSPDGRSGLAGVPDLQPLETWDAAEKNLNSGI